MVTSTKKKRIVLEPDHSSISASFTGNIEDIKSDIVTVIGTEENIREIESENPYDTTSTQKVISCGDKDIFQNRVSTITEAGDRWSSAEVLAVAEKLGTLTIGEASVMYKKEKLLGDYISYKNIVRKRTLFDKINRLCKFLSITSKEELKNAFNLKQKN